MCICAPSRPSSSPAPTPMVAGVGCISRAVEVVPASATAVGTIAAVPFATTGSCIHLVYGFLGASDLFGVGVACLLRCGVHILCAGPTDATCIPCRRLPFLRRFCVHLGRTLLLSVAISCYVGLPGTTSLFSLLIYFLVYLQTWKWLHNHWCSG